MSLKPYCVLYRDEHNERHEFCCYAENAYHARLEATELIACVHKNPNCIDTIRLEEHNFDW